jgi:hypothetical protein
MANMGVAFGGQTSLFLDLNLSCNLRGLGFGGYGVQGGRTSEEKPVLERGRNENGKRIKGTDG